MDKFFEQGYKFRRFEKNDRFLQIKITDCTKKWALNFIGYEL